ncbi:MAG: dTDP-4-dehydrorhamnose 3,5-epimerase [Lachnospiraceae bacterium]
MGKFTFKETVIEGVYEIEPTLFGDHRGYFMETYNQAEFDAAGLTMRFVQMNESHSKRGVLRGLHFQKEHPQGKLVRVTEGEVFDVAVDIRPDSKTYGKWVGVHLTAEKKNQFYIPEGMAHGFLVLSETATFVYQCTNLYDPTDEGGLMWNDPAIGIDWPIPEDMKVVLSDKDKEYPAFRFYHETRR